MQTYKIDQIRNVALLGHGGSGKTTLSEAMLFASGATTRLGRVEEGNTVSDFDPEEIRRHISVNTSVLPIEFENVKINLLDTPGFLDFVGEVKGAVRVADTALVVVDAAAGLQVGTELVWDYCNERNMPRMIVVTRMDREHANFAQALDSLHNAFPGALVPLQIPIGSEANFSGVVDLVRMKAYYSGKPGDIPTDLKPQAEAARQALIEAAAEGDDELIMKYLDGQELSDEEIFRGLKVGIQKCTIIPVMAVGSMNDVGIRNLMRSLVRFAPSPAECGSVIATNPVSGAEEELKPSESGPFAALVFKTTVDPFGKISYFRVYSGTAHADSRVLNTAKNEDERIGQLFVMRGKEQISVKSLGPGDIGGVVKLGNTTTGDTLCDKTHPLKLPSIVYPSPIYEAAVEPKSQNDIDKLSAGLQRLLEEDPTLRVRTDSSTHQTILSGMGDTHLAIASRRLQSKFGVAIDTHVPKVPYMETITKSYDIHARHKKQSGGRGQFGDVWIRFEPMPRGAGFEFADEVFGGSVPHNFIPAVEKGLREVLDKGVLAGFPTVDLKAALHDGAYHQVDSSEMAFKLAAHIAFKEGVPQAGPVLLEPIMNVRITVPEENMGDVMSSLNTKRGRVQGMDSNGGRSVVTAQVPLAEMQRYINDLRSMTQGRGIYTMEFSHYEVVPSNIAQLVISEYKQEQET